MLLVALALCGFGAYNPPSALSPGAEQMKCPAPEDQTEMRDELNYSQSTAPNMGVEDGPGWCLRFAQSAFGAPVQFESARKAWDGQQARHFDRPPKGVVVPIWFDHWGTYGSPAKYDNWGHVAVSLGDGRVLTSPLLNSHLKRWDGAKGEMVGSGIYSSIEALQRDLGGSPTYLGWSEYVNGKKIVTRGNPPPTPDTGQEEDEDMATRPIGHYIGGDDKTPAKERKWVIYYPDSYLYAYLGGVDQAYINTQAQVHGTKPFTRISDAHWTDQLRPHLDKGLSK